MAHDNALPATQRRRTRTILAGTAGAVAAAVTVWLVARHGAGMHLHTPGFGHARPSSLTPGFVAIVSAAAALLAWGALKLVERTARRPRRAWIVSGLVALAVSLSSPLSGHGVTGPDRFALICMHLAVGAVLIPVFAQVIRPRRSPDAVTGPGGEAAAPAKPAAHSPSAGESRRARRPLRTPGSPK